MIKYRYVFMLRVGSSLVFITKAVAFLSTSLCETITSLLKLFQTFVICKIDNGTRGMSGYNRGFTVEPRHLPRAVRVAIGSADRSQAFLTVLPTNVNHSVHKCVSGFNTITISFKSITSVSFLRRSV